MACMALHEKGPKTVILTSLHWKGGDGRDETVTNRLRRLLPCHRAGPWRRRHALQTLDRRVVFAARDALHAVGRQHRRAIRRERPPAATEAGSHLGRPKLPDAVLAGQATIEGVVRQGPDVLEPKGKATGR